MAANESKPTAFRFAMAFSTFCQLVFWVRMAPTMISNVVSAGHQVLGPEMIVQAVVYFLQLIRGMHLKVNQKL